MKEKIKAEPIVLDPVKSEFVDKLFGHRDKISRWELTTKICQIGNIDYARADKKMREMERQGYIVPIIESNYEDFYENTQRQVSMLLCYNKNEASARGNS